jgi:hypothetical protein
VPAQPKSPREGLQSGIGDAKGMQTWNRSLPSQLYDLQLSHNGISFRNLAQPQEAISHGKYGIITQFVLGIFAE